MRSKHDRTEHSDPGNQNAPYGLRVTVHVPALPLGWCQQAGSVHQPHGGTTEHTAVHTEGTHLPCHPAGMHWLLQGRRQEAEAA